MIRDRAHQISSVCAVSSQFVKSLVICFLGSLFFTVFFGVESIAQDYVGENYDLTLRISNSETATTIGRLGCREEGTFTAETGRRFVWESTAETSHLAKVAAQFDAGIGIETDIAQLGVGMSAVVELRRSGRDLEQAGRWVKGTKTREIAPMQCFDQTVQVVDVNRRYNVSGTLDRPFFQGGDFEVNIDLLEHVSSEIVVRADYNESCDANCALSGDLLPLLGEVSGDKLWAIVDSGPTKYFLPIYREEDYDLMIDIENLPSDALKVIRNSG